jgi:hypothetical protein
VIERAKEGDIHSVDLTREFSKDNDVFPAYLITGML